MVLAMLLQWPGWRPRVGGAVLGRRHISAQDLGRGCLRRCFVGQRLRRLCCNAPFAPRPRHATLSLHGAVHAIKLTLRLDRLPARRSCCYTTKFPSPAHSTSGQSLQHRGDRYSVEQKGRQGQGLWVTTTAIRNGAESTPFHDCAGATAYSRCHPCWEPQSSASVHGPHTAQIHAHARALGQLGRP